MPFSQVFHVSLVSMDVACANDEPRKSQGTRGPNPLLEETHTLPRLRSLIMSPSTISLNATKENGVLGNPTVADLPHHRIETIPVKQEPSCLFLIW